MNPVCYVYRSGQPGELLIFRRAGGLPEQTKFGLTMARGMYLVVDPGEAISGPVWVERIENLAKLQMVQNRETIVEAIREAMPPLPRTQDLFCACCGASTRGRQWHNRDDGYGLCPDCIAFVSRNETHENLVRAYGQGDARRPAL